MSNKYLDNLKARRRLSPAASLAVAVVAATNEAQPAPPVEEGLKLFFEKGSVLSAKLVGNILEVAFRDGKSAKYKNFTAALMEEWNAADSSASWFHNNVRLKAAVFPELK